MKRGDIVNTIIKTPKFQFTLPAIFDDSVSYYEGMAKLYKSYNNLVQFVNDSLEDFTTDSHTYTDQKIAEAFAEITRKTIELQVEYNNFESLVNSNLRLFQAQINEESAKLEAEVIGVNARTDTAIQQNNEYLLDMISKQLIGVKVLNYFTGEYVTVQEMFDYLAQFHLDNALTASTLASRQKTANEFAALQITATNLAVNGNTLVR